MWQYAGAELHELEVRSGFQGRSAPGRADVGDPGPGDHPIWSWLARESPAICWGEDEGTVKGQGFFSVAQSSLCKSLNIQGGFQSESFGFLYGKHLL